MVPIATLTPGQMMWIVNIYAPVAEEEISKRIKQRKEREGELEQKPQQKMELLIIQHQILDSRISHCIQMVRGLLFGARMTRGEEILYMMELKK